MDEQISLGVIAVLGGLAFGVVLFVPFVALSYRRRGGLSIGRMVRGARRWCISSPSGPTRCCLCPTRIRSAAPG